MSVRRVTGFILVLLVIVGLWLRTADLGVQPLWIDEIFTINGAIDTLEKGYPLLNSGFFYANNLLSVYVSSLAISLFGLDAFDPYVLRLPAAIFGAILIIIVYFFAQKIFNDRRVALISAFFVTFSTYELAWSRQVRGYAALAVFIVLALLLLWMYLMERKKGTLAFMIASYILACLSHYVALAFLPIFLTALFYKKLDGYLRTKSAPLYFLLACTAVPMLLVILLVPIRSVVMRYLLFPFLPIVFVLISGILVACYCRLKSRAARAGGIVIFAVIILVLSGSGFLTFLPKARFDLWHLKAPESDYNGALSFLKEFRQSGEIMISDKPVLIKVYMGEGSLWLPVSLANEEASEFYTGSKPINNATELSNIVENNTGYLLLTQPFYKSVGNRMHYILNNRKVRLVYESQLTKPESGVRIYRF